MYSVNNNINNSINQWADYWYYKIGVNVIPANTKEKVTYENWIPWQDKPLPKELHEIRKKNGEYAKGIAIVLGKIWRGKYQSQFLNGIDCDNRKAIEEVCSYKGNTVALLDLANWTIVEQHQDDPNRMHIYIRSKKPFRKKSSNKTNSELLKQIDANDIPAFEVKGLGQHGIFFCTPSIHKNGHHYQIIGTKEPVLCDEFENHLNSICKKYGIQYLDDYIEDDQTNSSKIPIQDLFQESFVILEGNNRHEGLLRAMESLLKRNQGILDLEQIKQLAQIWNQKHCEPPLDNKEFERQWECATKFINQKIKEQTQVAEYNFKKEFLNNTEREKDEKIPKVSVAEALRTNFGMIRVEGMITSRSNIYKMKYEIILSCINCGYSSSRLLDSPITSSTPRKEDCPSCEKERKFIETKSNYLNAVTAELQDIETFNEIERLPIILFDEDTRNINLGERVRVTGRIEIVFPDSKSKKKPHAVLYSRSIEYESKEEIVITTKDREAIERFTTKLKGKEKIIDEFVSMFDHLIIGHNYIKKGLLLAAVNTAIGCSQDNGSDGLRLIKSNNYNSNSSTRRDRINILIIGDPGLAKTLSLKRIVKLVPNSRYESSQNSSGKSLTAIISKEDENYILRLGPVPLAKWAICALNEFGRLDPEDQGHLLDVMEEGDFTINKHGINARIVSPTTIIASANPVNNSSWSEDQKINLNEIPALKPIIDRFDLIFVVRTPKDENIIRNYTYLKSSQEGSLIPDYSNYLKKHIAYAKRLNPIFSDEAKSILDEFFIRLLTRNKNKKDVFNSPRRRDSLYRIAKAISKLKLKDVIDVGDAKEAVEFYNVILLELERTVSAPEDPRDVAYKECILILRELKEFGGIALYELFKKASECNIQVRQYFGINKPLKIEHNSKTRIVYDMLLNHSNIKRVQDKPIVLQWITSSSALTYNNNSSASNNTAKNFQNNDDSFLSDISDTSDTKNFDVKKNSDSNICNGNKKVESRIDTTITNTNYTNLSPSDISDTSDKQNLINSNKNSFSNITKNIFDNKKSVSDISYVSDSILDQNIQEIAYENPLISESDLSIGGPYDPEIINNIDRVHPNSDRWFCNNCTLRDDKWGMMRHLCKHNKRKANTKKEKKN